MTFKKQFEIAKKEALYHLQEAYKILEYDLIDMIEDHNKLTTMKNNNLQISEIIDYMLDNLNYESEE